VDYGYEGEVLLMAPIEYPRDFQTGAKTEIAADVRYIVCREICVPEKAHLALSLPAPLNQSFQWRALFQRTRAQIPRKAPAAWKARASSDKNHFTLSVQTGFKVESAKFFPFEPAQVQNSALQAFTPTEKGFRLTLQKSDQLLKPINVLRGLVILGPGRAFEIAAPIVSR
jgi:thiol:disulfide interchange protein DsbD